MQLFFELWCTQIEKIIFREKRVFKGLKTESKKAEGRYLKCA